MFVYLCLVASIKYHLEVEAMNMSGINVGASKKMSNIQQ